MSVRGGKAPSPRSRETGQSVFDRAGGVWAPRSPSKPVDGKVGKLYRRLRPFLVYALPSGARLVGAEGQIVSFQGDAVVNAASPDCLGGGGAVDAEISAAGGHELLAARRALPVVSSGSNPQRCRRGSAVVTPGGQLSTKWCVHAVGPNYSGAAENAAVASCDAQLHSAYVAAMNVAQLTSFETVACSILCSEQSQRGTLSLQRVVDLAVDGICQADPVGVEEVHLVATSSEEVECIRRACDKHQRGHRALEHGVSVSPASGGGGAPATERLVTSPSNRRATVAAEGRSPRASNGGRVVALKQAAGFAPMRSSSLTPTRPLPHVAEGARVSRSASDNLGSVLSRMEDSLLFKAKLIVDLQKRKLSRNTADIQFRNEGMHRAAEVLTQVTDLSKLTRLKFLVDDIGTPCNCNMTNLLFKFLPDGSPLQQQVFDHFQTVALEARAAQAGQRRLSIQAQGRSPRTSSSGAPGHRSTEGSREDSSRTREMTDSESLSGSVPTSPRNPATSSATTDLSELGSRKNAGRRAESPRESALRVEVAGRKPLSNVALVVAELKLELGELREVQQPDPLDQRRRIILSDIDDTLYQSMTGGRKWPSKITIPGLRPLFQELARGRGGGEGGEHASRLHFISARPRELAGHTLRKLGPSGFGFRNVQMHTGRKQDLLLLPFNVKGAHAQIAAKKFKHFLRLHQIYPECEYFWFGDSGQGDIAMGASMLEEHPASVGGIYIHDVFSGDNSTPKSPRVTRQEKQTLGIHITDTYVAAAIDAYCRGKIAAVSLHRMVFETVKELKQVCETTPRQMYVQTLRLCCRDLLHANMYLARAGCVEVDLHDLLKFLAKVDPPSPTQSATARKKKAVWL